MSSTSDINIFTTLQKIPAGGFTVVTAQQGAIYLYVYHAAYRKLSSQAMSLLLIFQCEILMVIMTNSSLGKSGSIKIKPASTMYLPLRIQSFVGIQQ